MWGQQQPCQLSSSLIDGSLQRALPYNSVVLHTLMSGSWSPLQTGVLRGSLAELSYCGAICVEGGARSRSQAVYVIDQALCPVSKI